MTIDWKVSNVGWDVLGVWNNGFSCQPVNHRVRVCCGPENRRECCFADQLPHRSDLMTESDVSSNVLTSYVTKIEPNIIITPSSYTLILTAIGLTLALLLVLLIIFVYVIRRKLNESSTPSSSSSSSCSSKSSSLDKPCPRLSVTVANSSKSSASSPVASTYADYWSRTIISPSEWTLTKPYNSFIGGHPLNTYHYYSDQ